MLAMPAESCRYVGGLGGGAVTLRPLGGRTALERGPPRRTVYDRLPLDITPQTTIDEAAEALLRLESGYDAGLHMSYSRAVAVLAEVRACVDGVAPEPCRPMDRAASYVLGDIVSPDALHRDAARRRTAMLATAARYGWVYDAGMSHDMAAAWHGSRRRRLGATPYGPAVVAACMAELQEHARAARARLEEAIRVGDRTAVERYDALHRAALRDMEVMRQDPASTVPPPPEDEYIPHDEGDHDSGAIHAYLERIASGDWMPYCYEHGLALPGHGTRRDKCGQYTHLGCLRHGATRVSKVINARCDRLVCPVCCEHAMVRTALGATRRLLAHHLLLRSDIYTHHHTGAFTHFVVSMSAEHADAAKTREGRERLVSRIRAQLKELGYTGGVEVFHPWRFTAKLGRPYWAPHWHYVLDGYIDVPKYRRANARAIRLHAAVSRVQALAADTGDAARWLRGVADMGAAAATLRAAGSATQYVDVWLAAAETLGARAAGMGSGFCDAVARGVKRDARRLAALRAAVSRLAVRARHLEPHTMREHPVTEMHARTGDVWQALSTRYHVQELYGVIKYLLSHTGLDKDDRFGQAVRYWGTAAGRNFATDTILAECRSTPTDITGIADALEAGGREILGADIQVAVGADSVFDFNTKAIRLGDVEAIPAGALADRLRAEVAAMRDNPAYAQSSRNGDETVTEGDCHDTHGADHKTLVRVVLARIRYAELGKSGPKVGALYRVWTLDPSVESLCMTCHEKLQTIIPKSGRAPPPDRFYCKLG